jgi:phosphohistidine phosphatase
MADPGRASRRLVLVRHAKSDWPEGVPDHDRPLSDRGRRDAGALGRWLRDTGLAPDLVVVSTARRARQTWERAAEAVGSPGEVRLDDRVYGADEDDLLAVLRGTPAAVGTLAVVGHSPGTERVALRLDDGTGYARDAARLRAKLPTTGVAVLDVGPDWGEVGPRSCRLVVVAAPRG